MKLDTRQVPLLDEKWVIGRLCDVCFAGMAELADALG